MTNFPLRRSILPTTITLMACLPTFAQQSFEELKPAYSAKAKQEFEKLNLKGSLPPIDFSIAKWVVSESGSIPLPSELPSKQNGVFYIRDVRMNSSLTTPAHIGFYSEPTVRLVTGERILGKGDCVKIATDFASANFPWFFANGAPSPRITGPDSVGDYNIRWQTYQENELPDTRVWICVRSMDGKIIGFSSSRFFGSWEHKITATQAKEKAIAHFKAQGGFSDIQIDDWYVSGGGGKRWYSMAVRATKTNTSEQFFNSAEIDANDGSVLTSRHGWSRIEETDNTEIPTNDTLPTWTKAGLVFASNRPLAGRPEWLKYPEQLLLRSSNSSLSYLTCDLAEGAFADVDGSLASPWINLNWRGWTYGLNLDTGVHSVLTNPSRRIPHAITTTEGSWVVGYGATAKGTQVSSAMLNASKSVLYTHGRLKKAQANVQHLTISSDAKWLYFVSVQYINFKPRESIYRVSMNSIQKNQSLEIPKNDIQLIVEKIPADMVRLSIAKDGERLILQTTNGVFSCDVSKKTLHKIPMTVLKDEELRGAPIVDVQDAWAGPNSDEVTFSGKTKSNNITRRRIYSCRLDSTMLKSWTPVQSLPVAPYQFKATSKSADEVNKGMILQEIAWEEKERRR